LPGTVFQLSALLHLSLALLLNLSRSSYDQRGSMNACAFRQSCEIGALVRETIAVLPMGFIATPIDRPRAGRLLQVPSLTGPRVRYRVSYTAQCGLPRLHLGRSCESSNIKDMRRLAGMQLCRTVSMETAVLIWDPIAPYARFPVQYRSILSASCIDL
jgi:hypothetical protein